MILFSEVASLDRNTEAEANYDFAIELTQELLETILSRQSLFLSTKEVDKQIDEMHFADSSARILRDVPYSPHNFTKLFSNNYVIIGQRMEGFLDYAVSTSEEFMIISEHGVTWIANIDEQDSLVSSAEISFEKVREALQAVCSRP